jgi:formylmethanofuran dehydrogenase subunit E
MSITGNQDTKLPHPDDIFQDFLKEVKPIKFKEPLAETLGAFKEEGTVLEYTFTGVIKLAGHACPTTAGAYLACQKALEKLYPDEIPVRGEVLVTVYGESDEGVYGVMTQVISFLTGAAPETGFKGLAHKFKRKGLLKFNPEKIDSQAMCFEFRRADNDQAVLVKFYPQQIPFSGEKATRLGKLSQAVIWEAAREAEKKEFQELWMEKVKVMLLARKEIDSWLKIEVKEELK